MRGRLRLVRFALGRALIHAGLRIMPSGPARRDLIYLIANWASHVRASSTPQAGG